MNIEEILDEAFEDQWTGEEPWKKEEHKEVFTNGFAAGVANILASQNPAMVELRKTIDELKKVFPSYE